MFGNFFAIGSPKAGYYKGILMRANPTLHEEAIEVLKRHAPLGAKSIDIGAGQGAFSRRAADAGYDVSAVDTNAPDFKATEIDFHTINFDDSGDVTRFLHSKAGTFDLAIGMEVIEHVENPWEYVRFLSSLVRPGGKLLITTPNIESAISKIYFAFTSDFYHFTYGDYEGSGHINPLTRQELQIIMDGVGLATLESGTLCKLPKFTVSRNFAFMLVGLVNICIGWAMGKHRNGDILYFVAEKT